MASYTTSSSKFKRAWFFDSNPDATGTRFRTKNIPDETTYVNLLNSVAFLGEPGDMATTNKQGLVKIQTDNDAINDRNNPVVISGSQNVLKMYQVPGVGILGAVEYEESNPTSVLGGAAVYGKGIKVTGILYNPSGLKRIGYQIELALVSLADLKPDAGAKIPILNPNGDQGLADYNSGKSPDADKLSYVHSQDIAGVTWSVPHNLGWRPNINIEVGGAIIETEWVHIDDDNIEVRFTTVQTGKVYCS